MRDISRDAIDVFDCIYSNSRFLSDLLFDYKYLINLISVSDCSLIDILSS